MRSRSLPIVGLVLILVCGVAFGVYFFLHEGSGHNSPNQRISTAPSPEPDAPPPAPKPNTPAPDIADSTPGPAPDADNPRPAPAPAPTPPPDQPDPGVFRATITGRVVDGSNEGLPGIDVRATVFDATAKVGDANAPGAATTVTSGADGKFTIELTYPADPGVQSLQVRLECTARGWAQLRDSVLPGVRRNSAPPSVTLQVVEGGTVEGRVVDAQGSGIAGAEVFALPTATDDKGQAREGGVFSARTGADGVFRFEALPIGSWVFAYDPKSAEKVANRVPAIVEKGGHVRLNDIEVTAPASIRLRVVGEDGQPLDEGSRTRPVTLTFTLSDGNKQVQLVRPNDEGVIIFRPVPLTAVEMVLSAGKMVSLDTMALSPVNGQEAELGDIRMGNSTVPGDESGQDTEGEVGKEDADGEG